MSAPRHNRLGNCWSSQHVCKCSECGAGEMCDVCHEHDEPRGECPVCDECPRCVSEMSREQPAPPAATKEGGGEGG